MDKPQEQRMIAQTQRDKDDDLPKLCERFYQSVCYQMMRQQMIQCTSIQIIENEQIQKQKPKLDIKMQESMKQQQNQSQQKHSQDIQMGVQFSAMQPQIMIPNQSPNITNQITQQQQIITQIKKNKKKTLNDKKRTKVQYQTCYVVNDVLNILQEIQKKLLSKDGIYNSNNKRCLHFIVITAFCIRKFIVQKGGCTYEIIQKETYKSYRKSINKLQETKYKHQMAQYLAGFLLIIKQPQFSDATDGILYIYSKKTSQEQQSIENSQKGLKKMYEILESRKIINYNELQILRKKMLQWKVKF